MYLSNKNASLLLSNPISSRILFSAYNILSSCSSVAVVWVSLNNSSFSFLSVIKSSISISSLSIIIFWQNSVNPHATVVTNFQLTKHLLDKDANALSIVSYKFLLFNI